MPTPRGRCWTSPHQNQDLWAPLGFHTLILIAWFLVWSGSIPMGKSQLSSIVYKIMCVRMWGTSNAKTLWWHGQVGSTLGIWSHTSIFPFYIRAKGCEEPPMLRNQEDMDRGTHLEWMTWDNWYWWLHPTLKVGCKSLRMEGNHSNWPIHMESRITFSPTKFLLNYVYVSRVKSIIIVKSRDTSPSN